MQCMIQLTPVVFTCTQTCAIFPPPLLHCSFHTQLLMLCGYMCGITTFGSFFQALFIKWRNV